MSQSLRCVLLGDGHLLDIGGATSWGRTFADLLGWPETEIAAEGGTGYLSTGLPGGRAFPGRIQSVIAANPGVVIVAGGLNDRPFPVDAIAEAAGRTFTALRDGLPDATLICVGPFASRYPYDYTPVQAAIFAAAAPHVQACIDTCTDPWFTGQGKVSLPTGEGNSDHYISPDGVHFTQAGSDYIAGRMADEVRAILSGVPA